MSQYIRDKWGPDRGFLGGTVYSISQSADGYLWIGTERGLVRFDGFNFTLIQRPLPDMPPIGPVRGLLSDAEGRLWIRLDYPHLLLYRDGKFEDALARFDLPDVTLTAMFPDKFGGVLLSGVDNHTYQYRNGKFDAIAVLEVTGNVVSLAQTRDERIWIGTQNDGLFRISDGHIANVSSQVAESKINTLLAANDGGLWIGTDHGLLFWKGGGLVDPGLSSAIKQFQILAMTKDREGNVWAGTDHGLIKINTALSVSMDRMNDKTNNAVTAIFEDRDGGIWFGGSHGIERLRTGVFTTYSTAQGLPADDNGPVYVDSEERTWFAPPSGGLYWLKDGQIGRVTAAGLANDVVYSICGGEGDIWLGRQRGGLTLLTKSGDSFAARTYTERDGLAQNTVYSVHRNRDGSVWAGTVNAGVSRLKDGVFTNYSMANGLPSNTVNSIVEGHDGTMWFATPGGLASFANGHWTIRTAQDGLQATNARLIYEDSKHVLWIATSGGLAFLDSGKIRVPHDLPESLREQIFGLAEDEWGSLWITTSDHVLQVDRDRLLKGSLNESDVQSYGIGDGLQGVEGVRRDRSVFVDGLGRVWISLSRGLAMADPRIIPYNTVPLMVRIESILAGDAKVNPQGLPKIPAGSQSVTLNYASTNLSDPERVRFRYRLDGVDRGWSNNVASRQVVYTHLDPGTYHFHIIASNRVGLWNGPETIVPFVVEPMLWQTWWFRIACMATSLLAIFAVYRLRVAHLTRLLGSRFQERLAERTRIAQELHDTLLQGFLSARMQLDVAENILPEQSPAKPLIGRVLQMMGQVIEEGRIALQGLRTPDADRHNLEVALSRIRQEFAVAETVGYRVLVRGVVRPLRPLIRDEVYRIGREAVVNAFLHAKANSIEVEVEYGSRYLRVVVRDNGCGIDVQVLRAGRQGHWGLFGMRERSEGVGARLKLQGQVGGGTEVELTVPGRIAFEAHSNGFVSRVLSWFRQKKPGAAPGVQNKRGQQ